MKITLMIMLASIGIGFLCLYGALKYRKRVKAERGLNFLDNLGEFLFFFMAICLLFSGFFLLIFEASHGFPDF